jgi:hypothetical protein
MSGRARADSDERGHLPSARPLSALDTQYRM